MNPTNFEELQNRIQTIKSSLSPDPAIFGDQEKLSCYIDEVFERTATLFSGIDRHTTALSDREYRALKRRKKALINLCSEAEKRFAKAYPTLSVPAQLIHLNAPCTPLSFDELNRRYDIELAAAIYLLDALYDSEGYEDAAQLFPTSREELSKVYLPTVSDAVHSDDELRAMLILIRKGSCLGTLLNDGEPADLPYKEQFDSLTAIIGDAVATAQEQFICALWAFTDAVLNAANDRLGDLDKAVQHASAIRTAPFSDATVTSSELSECFDKLEEKTDHLERFYRLIGTPAEAEHQDADLYSDVAFPEIGDPYALCCALTTLSDDDHVWLYNLSCCVIGCACQLLPWAGMGAVGDDNSPEEMDVDYEYLASLIEKTPGWDDNRTNALFYQKLLPSPLAGTPRKRISISQLTFLSSGLIPPRRGGSINYTRALLHEADLSEEQRELLYEYFALAYAINHKEPDYSALEEDDGDDTAAEDSAAENKLLRAEIKRLKHSIHQFDRRNKETEKQLSHANKKLDALNLELAELRTMIREAQEDDERVTVSFPYTAKKRSVIIGGHDSWLKAIRPLLENVRYISSSEQPNPNLILGSEVVWLQTNAMGHSGYYKVMDVARRNRIKVCYFRYSSAEKCAEQFALEDSAEPDETEE